MSSTTIFRCLLQFCFWRTIWTTVLLQIRIGIRLVPLRYLITMYVSTSRLEIYTYNIFRNNPEVILAGKLYFFPIIIAEFVIIIFFSDYELNSMVKNSKVSNERQLLGPSGLFNQLLNNLRGVQSCPTCPPSPGKYYLLCISNNFV